MKGDEELGRVDRGETMFGMFYMRGEYNFIKNIDFACVCCLSGMYVYVHIKTFI